MSRGFGATYGTGSTDSVETTLTTHATQRSYGCWLFRHGQGGGNIGRVFDKRVSGAQVELLFVNSLSGYTYQRVRSVATGTWTVPTTTVDAWEHLLVTIDNGDVGNDPVFYIDGVEVAAVETTTPVGTLTDNADAYVIGNRKNDNARNWDGMLAEFAVWSSILTADQAALLGAGFDSLEVPGLVYFASLRDGTALDSISGAACTVVGALSQDSHPTIYAPPHGSGSPDALRPHAISLRDHSYQARPRDLPLRSKDRQPSAQERPY